MSATKKGADALLDVLEAWGVDHVFSCPGTTEVPLLDALVGRGSVRFVLTTHESVAVAMADGYARASGRPGVAYLHTNVGLTNGLAHLYSAHTAGSPVVVLTGVKPTATLPHRALTTTPYIRDLARPYCKSDWMTLRPDALVADLHRAFSAAVAAPTGPTFLAIPQDILAADLQPDDARPLPVPPVVRAAPDPATVEAAADLLTGAARPVIIAGGEVARHGAMAAIGELATVLDAPVLAESRRDIEATAIGTDHLNFVGCHDHTSKLVQSADVIFLAGSPTLIEMEPGRFPAFPESAALVHLTEDNLELGRRHVVTVGLHGNARLAVSALLDRVVHLRSTGVPARAENLPEARAAYLDTRRRPALPAGTEPVTVAGLVEALARVAAADDIVVLDAVTTTEPLLDGLPRTTPGSLHATATGSLGWGMGAALGVQLAQPHRTVTCVVGDGVFQFGLPALWTAQAYDLPVRFVVVNNGAYAAVRNGLRRYGGLAAARDHYPLTSIAGVDAATVAHGFGMAAQRAASHAELARSLDEMASNRSPVLVDGPVLVDVVVTDPSQPAASGG